MKQKLPWIITLFCAVLFVASLRPPHDETWHLEDFATLPILANGRAQPMDSLARNSLLQLREKRRIYLKDEKRYLSATAWLMEVMMKPEVANDRRSFRIDHPEVRSLLNLPDKGLEPDSLEDGKHYTWSQISPGLDEIRSQAQRISQKEATQRTHFERALMKLQERVFIYMRLQNTLQPQDTTDFLADMTRFKELAEPGMAAFRARQAGQEFDQADLDAFSQVLSRYEVTSRFDPALLVPPRDPVNARNDWLRIGQALMEVIHGQPLHPAVTYFATMSTAFRQDKPDEFQNAVNEYRAFLAKDFQPEMTKVRNEYFFNYMEPFYIPMYFYVLAFLLACCSWFNMSAWLRKSAMGLTILAFVIHTAGLLYRMILEGRPPVTNLYSSAIFIGWGAVIMGVVVDWLHKNGVGTAIGSIVGFVTLVIAHNLSLNGDTMEMMRAVLDTNFWLATHVVVITLGYSSTFMAGSIAIFYLLLGICTPVLSAKFAKSLSGMVYGIICFATLFSFVGTVLGGIWADQSWGRFWGWDPKENGALIIVLWNALILHARWGGMIRDRGLMAMAIFGNIVTAWSWFGVNMLGIGLHSYGFMDSAFIWLMIFVVTQLAFISLGMLPQRMWFSFKNLTSKAGPPSLANTQPQPSAK